MKRAWLKIAAVAVGCLALGLGLSWLLLVEVLHPPPSHVMDMLRWNLTSGVVSLAAGTLALLAVSRFIPSLGLKIGLACVCGSTAGVVNIMVTPLLMFKEHTDFDLLVINLVYFIAISLAFGFMVALVTTRQVHALHQGALKVASGELGTTVVVQGADEVADLSRAFNRMSLELDESFQRTQRMDQERRSLIAAVSHDLRTPLTSMRAMIEAINDGIVAEPEAVQRYLGLIQHESEHLGRLIEDLFELSRIESGNLELRMTTVPLPELVMETVDGLRIQAEEKGIELRAVCPGNVPPLALDGPRMQRVLVNLIQNALRHTPPGGQVKVELKPLNGKVQLAVADTGEGIAPEDQAHVFDQFYRSEKSRSRGSGGAGLGLAIARGIVEAHRGSIQVESRVGQGSRFVVTL